MVNSLVQISFTPVRSPQLFAFYLMDRVEFETKYASKLKVKTTIHLTDRNDNGMYSYDLELYLPNCSVTIIDDKDQINSYKVFCKSRFFGCVDILAFLDKMPIIYTHTRPEAPASKRRRIDFTETPDIIDILSIIAGAGNDGTDGNDDECDGCD